MLYTLLTLNEALPHLSASDLGIFSESIEDIRVAVIDGDHSHLGRGAITFEELLGGPVQLVQESHILGALLIRGSLNLPHAAYVDWDNDWSPSLVVQKNLNARALALSGGHTRIGGDCNVTQVIFGHYNHGSLHIQGETHCPWILSDDYAMEFVGRVVAKRVWGAPSGLNTPCANIITDFEKLSQLLDDDLTDPRGWLLSDAIVEAISSGQSISRPRGKENNAAIRIPKEIKLQLDALAMQEQSGRPVHHVVLKGNLRGLPEALRNFKQLKLMHLDGLSMSQLPTWIGDYPELETLRITDCDLLSDLPDDLALLTALTTLDLKESGVKRLPLTIGGCSALREIRFGSWSESAASESLFRDYAFQYLPQLERLSVYMYNAPVFRWAQRDDWHTDALSGLKALRLYRQLSGPLTEDIACWSDLETLELRVGKDRLAVLGIATANLPLLRHFSIDSTPHEQDALVFQAMRDAIPSAHLHGAWVQKDEAQNQRFEELQVQLESAYEADFTPFREKAITLALQWQEYAVTTRNHLLCDANKTIQLQMAILQALTVEASACQDPTLKFERITRLNSMGQNFSELWQLPADWVNMMTGSLQTLSAVVQLNYIWYLLRNPHCSPTDILRAGDLLDNYRYQSLAYTMPNSQDQTYNNLRRLHQTVFSETSR